MGIWLSTTRFFGGVEGQPGDFDGQPYRTYNVAPNALLVNFKAVRFQFLPDPNGRDVLITADPMPENLNIVNRLSLADGPCQGYQAGISFDVRDPQTAQTVVFSGSFPEACAPYSLSRTVLEHDTFALGVFTTLWQGLGGRHQGRLGAVTVGDGLDPALIWHSRPLAEIIRSINKYSNNVMTRQLLYTLGAEQSVGPGTRESGVDVIRNYLVERELSPESLVMATVRVFPDRLASRRHSWRMSFISLRTVLLGLNSWRPCLLGARRYDPRPIQWTGGRTRPRQVGAP
ncbi:MAG: hypothetical protein CM1200mP36_08740 [Gammaproteobacteria bacterium]|nr:MAG: hypothetical protein CM1200mP36_08740 [Gammaproteobacteria bacterium]